MASHVYRYALSGLPFELSSQVPGAPSVGSTAPTQYVDVTADDQYLEDLNGFMSSLGFSYFSTDPTLTPAQQVEGSAANALTGASRVVRAATTTNLPALFGLFTIDGVGLEEGDRVLVKNQLVGGMNGIYNASSTGWTFAPDWFTGSVVPEMTVGVSEGTINAHSDWSINAKGIITVGVTNPVFVRIFTFSTNVAGGDLQGTYPNPTLSDAAKFVGATAGGDLTGVFPNPTISSAAKAAIVSSVTLAGVAGGGLTGTYPNPTVASIAGLAAGGDLAGTYPNPTVGHTASTVQLGSARTVKVASTGNLPLVSGAIVDGVSLVSPYGHRVLVKDQTDSTQNGIYITAAGSWQYAPDWVNGAVVPEMLVNVSEGAAQAHTDWSLQTQGAITVGVTGVTFTQPAMGGTAGGGLAGTYPNPTVASIAGLAAGGDLQGTYPNPSISDVARTTTGLTRVVRVASTATMSASGLQTVDDVQLVAGDRVLLKDQTIGTQNGIWVAAPGLWTKAADWITGHVYPEMQVAVSEGTVNSHTNWFVTSQGVITVGTTAITLAKPTTSIDGLPAGGDLQGTFPNPTIADVVKANLGMVRSVRLASTVNSGIVNTIAVDGVSTADGDRVLLMGQATPSQNGIWIVRSGAYWERPTDWVTGSVYPEMVISVSEGATHAHTDWSLTNQGSITVPTTALTFANATPLTPGAAAGGMLSGTYPNPSVASISGLAAGGDLTGTYPNPSLSATLKGQAGATKTVRLASTINLNPGGINGGAGFAIDGVVPVTGDRVLFKNQSSPAQNGVYLVPASGASAFAPDWVTGAVTPEDRILVSEGATNAHTEWAVTTQGPLVVGSTALTIANVTPLGTGSAAGGMLSGTYPNPSVASITGIAAGGDLAGNYPSPTVTAAAKSGPVQGASTGNVVALTSVSNNIAINLALANNFSHTLGQNTNLSAPSNPVAGQSGVIIFTQPASLFTLTYNSFWKFPGGTVPSLSTTAGAVDIFSYYVESATRAFCSLLKDMR